MRHTITNKISIILSLVIIASTMMMPLEVQAASTKKSKVSYSIKVTNINSNTVIKKGAKLKIQYKATQKKGGVVKGTKVKFKSSNKKVATVSKKGVIKAKKKGTTYITVYCKNKPSKYKRIKIRVGTPINSISISGIQHMQKGRSVTFKAKTNSSATNKKLKWISDNTSVATVSSSGKVTAKALGTATIYATALDGSGVKGSHKVYVHQFMQDDARWIAHRGLHESETENTAAAFEAAGMAGFWGCECDVWETKHIVIGNEGGSEEDVLDSGENTENTDNTADTEDSQEEFFDIVINHDATFRRTMGFDQNVRDMTAVEIREQLPNVCFFSEYLDICKRYNMVPVVEFKDASMSDDAVKMIIDELERKECLKDAILTSFYSTILDIAMEYATERLNGELPRTYYIFNSRAEDNIVKSNSKGYTGIYVRKDILTEKSYYKAKNLGLSVGTWTYYNNLESDNYLYNHLLSGNFQLEFAAIDYKLF